MNFKMTFFKQNNYYYKSNCGKYTISVSLNNKILLFKILYKNVLLETVNNAEIAYSICNKHKIEFNKNNEKSEKHH